VNLFRQERGDGAAFRLIPSDCPTLKQLNMPPILTEMALKEKGLILVTGPREWKVNDPGRHGQLHQ